jgi:hypothetical protein
MATFRHLFRVIQAQGPWYLIGLGTAIGCGALSWYVWHQFGADQTLPSRYLWIAHSLALLNLGLSLYTLERESFASALLLGTTLFYELLILIFLYVI